jgi:hypothetical protein
MPSWSDQIADRYAMKLSPDLRSWFDDEIWQEPGGAEFCQPVTPRQLLDSPEELIWGGFLPPDMLPLIGNDYGDWLAARVGFDGEVSEVVYWWHGGGDWQSYGATLAEALLFDAAFRQRHGVRVQHVSDQRPHSELFHYADWAWRQSSNHSPLPRDDGDAMLSVLEESELCRVAVARERVLDALNHPLKRYGNPPMAAKIGWKWMPQLLMGLFDASLIPVDRQPEILVSSGSWTTSFGEQDWNEAERLSIILSQIAPTVGWAWDISAWSAERRGDLETATQRYQAGLHCSVFSGDTVGFHSHWYPDAAGKFAAHRLIELAQPLSGSMAEYLDLLRTSDEAKMRETVREFWQRQATVALAADDPQAAYSALYRAGWDIGLTALDAYATIIDALRSTALAANATALAKVAEVHQQSLG